VDICIKALNDLGSDLDFGLVSMVFKLLSQDGFSHGQFKNVSNPPQKNTQI